VIGGFPTWTMCMAVGLISLQGRRAVAEEQSVTKSDNGRTPGHPDVVRLKNGGFLRGTIAESIPNESVTIVTIAGETKRFLMSEVEYAGPASLPGVQGSAQVPPAEPSSEKLPEAAPPSSASVAPPRADKAVAEVHFESEPVGVTFYQHSDLTAAVVVPGLGAFVGYKAICTAPCKAELPVGTHALAMAYRGSPPREAPPVQLERGPARLHGDYVSRSGTRTAGFIVGPAGFLAGAVVIAIGFKRTKTECFADFPCHDVGDPNQAVMTAGMGISVVSALLGIYLITRQDYVELNVSAVDSKARAPVAVEPRLSRTYAQSTWRTPESPGATVVSFSGQF
jgi:hypothetical protein